MASDSSRIMVFRPTIEEFKDFAGYIRKMEAQGAHKAGIAKVIPPKGWFARRNYSNIDLVIPAPITQVVTGKQGLFQLFNVQKKGISFDEFKKLANSERYKPPEEDFDELERKYWKNLTFNSPTYGADVSGSIFDDDVDDWNISQLDTILKLIDKEYQVSIEGVNTPYLYFGMWKATFAWHTEDMDLYSINYIHFGAPKTWYAIPPEHGSRLERLASGFFPGSYQSCPQFLRHKMTIISPMVLKKFSVPFDKVTQEAGEFMVTFPRGFHCGFNHGFNCAESTNFASERWIDYGKKALSCQCKSDSVKICMDIFVKTFQPDQWDEYLANKSEYSDTDSDEEAEDKRRSKVRKQETKTDQDDEFALAKLKQKNSKESGTAEAPRNVVSPVRSSKRQRPVTKSFTVSRTTGVRKDLERAEGPLHSSRLNKKQSHLVDCLAGLWQWQQVNSELEVAFNVIISQLQPKCSICFFFAKQQVDICCYIKQLLFQVLSDVRSQNLEEEKGTLTNLGKSVPLIPEICFTSDESSAESMTSWLDTHLTRETPSQLLQCTSCRIMVHTCCYGVTCVNGERDDPWLCDRCKDHIPKDKSTITLNDVHCCLCRMRGGALKRTKDNSWIHVGCAIVIPEVTFDDITQRDNIDISEIPQARKKLKCLHCRETTRGVHISACTQCTSGKCAIAFHPTCSVFAGGPMVAGDWPQRVEAYCDRHRRDKFKAQQRDFSEIRCGQSVIAKHKNGRYYRGSVLDMTSEEFYVVTFDDGSFYDKLPPQDIEEYSAQQGDIPEGSKVHVKWNDEEQLYPAVVTGCRISVTYQVKFEDESVLGVRREDVYKEGEEIPKKVRQKMSSATETADIVKAWSVDVKRTQKRKRKENSLYQEFTS